MGGVKGERPAGPRTALLARGQGRRALLEQVRNPLVFFALALLVIEGIFGVVVSTSEMTGEQQLRALLVMAALFVFVVLVVAGLAVWFPRHLYEKIADDIYTAGEVRQFVTSTTLADAILDVVEARLSNRTARPGPEATRRDAESQPDGGAHDPRDPDDR